MAVEEARCRGCGRPLEGRDRFEGKCPVCREAEVLGRALPPDALAVGTADGGPPAERRTGRGWALVLLGAAGVAALAAVWILGPREPGPRRAGQAPVASPKPGTPTPSGKPSPTPPPVPAPKAVPAELHAALQQETVELLGLLARQSYDRVVDNYVQPDAAEFARTERVLDDIVQGSASKGFSAWAARGVRLREARVAEDLRRAGDEQAEFTAALLAFLVREPSASDAATSSEDRARSVLRWHLAALFGGLEVEKAEVSDMAAAGASSVEVSLACRGERRARWLRAEPARLCWSKLPVGWIIKLGLAERLERARDVLKRPLAGESPSAPGAAP